MMITSREGSQSYSARVISSGLYSPHNIIMQDALSQINLCPKGVLHLRSIRIFETINFEIDFINFLFLSLE